MTKLEAIARIIDPAWWRTYDELGTYRAHDMVQAARKKQIAKAREVVEALREPTEAMIAASAQSTLGKEFSVQVWRSMCDAILSEAEEEPSS